MKHYELSVGGDKRRPYRVRVGIGIDLRRQWRTPEVARTSTATDHKAGFVNVGPVWLYYGWRK